MEYDSESSCEDRLRDLEASEELPSLQRSQKNEQEQASGSAPWHPLEGASFQPKVPFGVVNRSLSSQVKDIKVMEYYRKYSQNSNLEQYFSLPTTSASSEGIKYYYSLYELNPKPGDNGQCYKDFNLKSYVPKERRRWVRPPLVGQSCGTDSSGIYARPLADPSSPSPELKRATPETIPEEKSECHDTPDITERKAPSPTSSVASHRRLEWDSGADVGYYAATPHNKQESKKLSTIERMALARGCSAALRLDPEGTTESAKMQTGRLSSKSIMRPDANSTSLKETISGSESEVEITPIVKNHLSGVITGSDIKSEERKSSRLASQLSVPPSSNISESIFETPKSSGVFKVPVGSPVKYATEGRRIKARNLNACTSPLKKSSSMNILAMPTTKVPLKRSQSDLNLDARDKSKVLPRLIFNSTSSIATVVNKPTTCDKVIQTSFNVCSQESVGVQVSALEEEKPPLPKRGTSLTQRSLHSILKNSRNTYKVQPKRNEHSQKVSSKLSAEEQSEVDETRNSSLETGTDSSPVTPQPDDTENITGRANSFEYFPGHIYENVPNGSASHVSSVDTGRSNSTMPNTSSSVDEKLWGESDSLVRDLERSVNILKSLVDANKYDKDVKKRLIHHVVKRLVTTKYTDDRIEHNLEENVPWNPDDARKKVYRSEIIQALAKKHNTTDSSDDWKPQKKKIESSNSDKFDRNTDRTEMDGRKARMGLRTDDCGRSSNTPTDPNKSESSECFMPQRNYKSSKIKNIFCMKKKCEVPHGETTTSNSSAADQNRVLLDAAINSRRSPEDSSNQRVNDDWRLPTTVSERQFELRRCSNSDSGDSKLVSYAEMEKKNQLIWITNEISHLSNLKKLLEQPKKLDRPKQSPRKSQPVYKRPLTVPTCMPDTSPNPDSTPTPDVTENSWSSHCNLASCHNIVNSTATNLKQMKQVKKRNSFTQTSTETADAHSKTGGVIVSSKDQNHVQLANAYVQTLQVSSNQVFNSAGPVVCPVHQSFQQVQNCRCGEQTFQCQKQVQNTQHCGHRVKNPSLHNSPKGRHQKLQRFHRKEDRSVNSVSISPSPSNDISTDFSRLSLDRPGTDDNNLKQKDAKNHANTTRSRFARVDPNCRCVLRLEDEKAEKYKKSLDRICDLCSRCDVCKYDKSCECLNNKFENKEDDSQDSRESSSEKSEVVCQEMAENGHLTSRKTCKKTKKFCGCSGDCNCEFKVDEAKKSCRDCGEKMRSCHLTNSNEDKCSRKKEPNNVKCKCDKDCVCSGKFKDAEERINCQKYAPRKEFMNGEKLKSPEKSCKCCRTCGTAYQKNRKCECRISYPQPVAYELSFVENNRERKSSSKSENAEAGTLGKVSSSNSLPLTARSATCSCEDVKLQKQTKCSEKKNSLQEYLISNRPQFLEDMETRRHYLNEISQLRELRKEKRVQLIAMASSSSLFKPTVPTKTPKPVRRKLTDEAFKERLRKRYMRLNEVRSRRHQQEKQEEMRRNKLMARIFGKKLQQKVLRGQMDLSQSEKSFASEEAITDSNLGLEPGF
ncbi:uncharacterized protein LOC117166878 isoform X2 [Belonocnema kinseyi]|uniref:uncharacterized protein LOC117166878 isoform X2 n=1 Tax=Belonocnema kinseyi TaxID=2817044 RepID=UPI00143CCD41|nr:uncharacterized protein LOC117166878 isoform X2 [Belonocnema kinseyi]